jgi:catechol 2,3-dioxygenase-like lactoylglutathione lyase family enzyme
MTIAVSPAHMPVLDALVDSAVAASGAEVVACRAGFAPIEGAFADEAVGLDGIRSEIAMMRTPDGHGRLELTKYLHPGASATSPAALPPNTLGLHRVMFAVDDLDDTLARLRPHGAEVLRAVANYEDTYRLCYVRGPAGIILALAQQIG